MACVVLTADLVSTAYPIVVLGVCSVVIFYNHISNTLYMYKILFVNMYLSMTLCTFTSGCVEIEPSLEEDSKNECLSCEGI